MIFVIQSSSFIIAVELETAGQEPLWDSDWAADLVDAHQGPEEGWVSPVVSGKDIVVKVPSKTCWLFFSFQFEL